LSTKILNKSRSHSWCSFAVGSGVFIAALAHAAPVAAQPAFDEDDDADEAADRTAPVEAGGFGGAQFLPKDIGVGDSMDPSRRPHSSPLLGLRVGYLALPDVAGGERAHLDIGIEGEIGMATSYAGVQGSYFSPLVDWRADVLLRLRIGRSVMPHLAIGGGGVTMISSPETKTRGEITWGFGATFALSEGWGVRFDVKQDLIPRVKDDFASALEATLGISVPIGRETHHRHHEEAKPKPEPTPPPPPPPTANTTSTTVTASAPPTPVPPAGSMPTDPNLDTDKDGIPDVKDKCPLDAENVNGFQDADGCPDKLPDAIVAGGPALKFAAGRAKLDAADETTLKGVIDVMVANPDLKLVVLAHPEGAGKKGEELAQRRAESVRWFLIEHGVAEVSRVTSKVGDAAPKGGAIIELQVAEPAPTK
jgi:outer membrane protein OmpA-like peptidoglycan-associated protein